MDSQITTKYTIPRIVGIPTIPNSPRTPIQSPRRPQVPPAPRKRRQISDKDLEYWRLDLIKKIIKKMIKLKG